MLTFFSIPKPFVGHTGVIQENAIRSWVSCIPEAEIILFGDEIGTAEITERYGCRHITSIRCNESGTPYLSDAFEKVQKLAKFDTICYVNGDIFFLSGIFPALSMITYPNFLMVGRRTNLDVTNLIDLQDPQEVNSLRECVLRDGKLDKPWAMDYFIFPRGLIRDMPRFVVGRAGWDNWMIWYHVKYLRIPVIDATEMVMAIHQRHDYQHIKKGSGDQWEGEESEINRRIMGGWEKRYFSILDASHRFNKSGMIIEKKRGNFWSTTDMKRLVTSIIPYPILNTARIFYHEIIKSNIIKKGFALFTFFYLKK